MTYYFMASTKFVNCGMISADAATNGEFKGGRNVPY